MKRFSLEKFNDVEGKEQYHVEISDRFASLENLGLRWVLLDLGKLLETTAKFQSKRV
jgi:hypothetical protein